MDYKINGFIYVRAGKGIYGLVQACIIAHTASKEHIQPFVFENGPITLGLWRHNKNRITFNLVVNNLLIRCHIREDALHLIYVPQEKYNITQDWTGIIYSGITLNWDYKEIILDISIPGYVKETLHKIQHPNPIQTQHSPHQGNPPNYGSTAPQMAHQAPELTNLAPLEANTFQQVVGNFL